MKNRLLLLWAAVLLAVGGFPGLARDVSAETYTATWVGGYGFKEIDKGCHMDNFTWTGETSGYWCCSGNWSGLPEDWMKGADTDWGPDNTWGPSFHVIIPPGDVTVYGSAHITSLSIGAGATLEGGLTLDAGLENNGRFLNAAISFDGRVHPEISITGQGVMTLDGGWIEDFIGTYGTLSNSETHTIDGYGAIGRMGAFNNAGTINANVPGMELGFALATVNNTGMFKATNGGTLALSCTIDNTGGIIKAESGSTVRYFGNFGNNSLNGGTIFVDPGAEMILEFTYPVNAQSFDNHGTVLVRYSTGGDNVIDGALENHPDGVVLVRDSVLQLNVDAMINAGQIHLESVESHAYLNIGGDLTLTGGGVLNLGDDPANTVDGVNHTEKLINQDNTIQGSGVFVIDLVNYGTVDANVNGKTLALNSGAVYGGEDRATNHGLMKASNGGILSINTDVTGNGALLADGGEIQFFGTGATSTNDVGITNGGELHLLRAAITIPNLLVDGTSTLNVNFDEDFTGSTLNLTGKLSFAMTDEALWQWGKLARLRMAGGIGADPGYWENWASLEVAGSDLGDQPQGYTENFNLPYLVIGPGARVYLADQVNNGNRNGSGGESEALYVETLYFEDNAGLLNLNGIHLYYKTLYQGSPDQIIDIPVIPTATTGAASNVAETTATLNGSVNPNGFSPTAVVYEYGLTTAYGQSIETTPGSVQGMADQAVSANLTGLTPGSTYHFRIKATNAMGAAFGQDRIFTTVIQHPLTVTKSGTGSGTVTSSPAGISCGSSCTASFIQGTQVSLSALVAPGSFFSGWSGACSGAGDCTVAMDGPRAVTATFVPAAGTVTGRAGIDVAGHTDLSVIGATVTLAGTAFRATTDADGNFVIPNVPLGAYTLVVSGPNLAATKHPVTLTVGGVDLPVGTLSMALDLCPGLKGDINDDGRIGIVEAIHALQVAGGIRQVMITIKNIDPLQTFGIWGYNDEHTEIAPNEIKQIRVDPQEMEIRIWSCLTVAGCMEQPYPIATSQSYCIYEQPGDHPALVVCVP